MSKNLNPSVQKVKDVLKERGFSCQILALEKSTRTAAEAAEAVGCRLGQIAKSLVFRGTRTGKTVLIIASGANRVDEKKMEEFVGEPIEKADADFVHEHTGFSIGGVSPIGHLKPLESFIDEDLLQYNEIWAAAGSPFAVFKLSPLELSKMTCGRVIGVK